MSNRSAILDPDPLEDLSTEELLDRAGVPTMCPPILYPGQVEAVLNFNRTQRRHFEDRGKLTPMPRKPYEHARYLTVDLARNILECGFRTYWHRLDDA